MKFSTLNQTRQQFSVEFVNFPSNSLDIPEIRWQQKNTNKSKEILKQRVQKFS